MPIHDWTRVEAGIFLHFHHAWISEIGRVLNRGLLPDNYYALVEQRPGRVTLDAPLLQMEERKKNTVVIRHVGDDRMVATLAIISRGNKATRAAFRAILDDAIDLLENHVHLLVIDLFPPATSDPYGIHAAIWQEVVDEAEFQPPSNKPLTLVSYESGRVHAYVEPVAVGDVLPTMPLALAPNWYAHVPLEGTYQAAWQAVPRRWQRVLEGQHR